MKKALVKKYWITIRMMQLKRLALYLGNPNSDSGIVFSDTPETVSGGCRQII
jgi:hypothetical protein